METHNNNNRPYRFFHDEKPATAQIITSWLREIMDVLDLHTPPGVSYSCHSLCDGGVCGDLVINVRTTCIIAWGLWRDFNTTISYIDVNVQQDQVEYIFFSNLLATG